MRKIGLCSSLLLLASLLSSCANDSYDGVWHPFTNMHGDWASLNKDLEFLATKDGESSLYYFDFRMEGYETSYEIDGVCPCEAKGYVKNYAEEHSPVYCDHLIYRHVQLKVTKGQAFEAKIRFEWVKEVDPEDIAYGSFNVKSVVFRSNEETLFEVSFPAMSSEDEAVSFLNILLETAKNVSFPN